ncbi:MAG: hypothetical protein QHJ73_03620, partial [Armatimonadota bacterium]|nr:hypothetical protein [Armatimonadota bacterium]
MSESLSCRFCLTRRQCLKLLSAAALAPCLAGERVWAATGEERIDAALLRPQGRARVTGAILRQRPPYWLGWPGTAYDLERHQKEYAARLNESARRLGIDVALEGDPVQDEKGLGDLLGRVKEQRPDGLVVILEHIGTWNW